MPAQIKSLCYSNVMDPKYKEAYEFLTNHKFAVLSTASKGAEPWGATVYYVVDEQLNFFFLTHVQSKKYQDIQEQPNAAITVADDNEQVTVQASGTVTQVPLGQEHDHAFRMLALVHPPGQFDWVPPVTKMDTGEMLLLKLVPDYLRFSNFMTDKSAIKEIIP